MKKFTLSALFALLWMGVIAQPALRKISGIQLGNLAPVASATAAEIVKYDSTTKRLFVVNGLEKSINVFNFNNPRNPISVDTITFGVIAAGDTVGGINSVDVYNGLGVCVMDNKHKLDSGFVAFFNATNGSVIKILKVGVLPDMVTFTPDGKKVLIAIEGEPDPNNTNPAQNPEGAIAFIDLTSVQPANLTNASVVHLGFTAYDSNPPTGIKNLPNHLLSRSLEPEYIVVNPTSDTAWAVCQEANAIAVIELVGTPSIVTLKSLGFKNHMLANNKIDASDRANVGILLKNWPVKGMYQPDGLALFTHNGKTYIASANEGDASVWDDEDEEARVGSNKIKLDPTVFPNASALKNNDSLGRLNVTKYLGNTDADADFEELYVFGARSFSIWDAAANLVWDSGDQFERIISDSSSRYFNVSNSDTTRKSRSDNKGPEPEGVAVGMYGNNRYAFVSLERQGGILVYDITNPTAPSFKQYINTRKLNIHPSLAAAGDNGPEGIIFVPKDKSPNDTALVITANEVSGTVAVFAFYDANITSVKNKTLSGQLLVYPNPANSQINVNWNSELTATVSVRNLEGKVIWVNRGIGRLTIPVSNLAKGMYLISVQTADSYDVRSVIVE